MEDYVENNEEQSRPVRITDVAREAGVSGATVSYVLNHKGNIAPETRTRVKEAIERLNYKPNAASRTLSSGRSRALGLVAPRGRGGNDPFYSEVVAGIIKEANKLGYHIVLIPGDVSAETLIKEIRSLLVDGIFLLEVEQRDNRIRLLKSEKIPLTLLGSSEVPIDWVEVDNYRGGWMATTHLLELGHRRIAHLAAPSGDRVGRLRRKGYEDCLRSCDTDLMPIMEEAPMTLEGGFQAGKKLLMLNPRPTAIFVAADIMAEGLIQAAALLNVKIPREVSVVGFDDIPMAKELTIPLTTVSQNAEDIGQQMTRQLVRQLEGGNIQQNTLLPELVVRESTTQASVGALRPSRSDYIVVKRGHCFSLWSKSGMIEPREGNQGVFYNDTHWINAFQVHIDGRICIPTWTNVDSSGFSMRYVIELTEGTLDVIRRVNVTESSIHDEWSWTRWDGAQPWAFEVHIAPDFRDIFELRGFQVVSKGTRRSELLDNGNERHHYIGRDGISREIGISFDTAPDHSELGFKGWIVPAAITNGQFLIEIDWRGVSSWPSTTDYLDYAWPQVILENSTWQRVLDRSRDDLVMLRTNFGRGPVFAAGLPWFGTLFGRDAIISALQCLPFDAQVAEGTLATLAEYQGTMNNPVRCEMPGKMVHEVRVGELANTGTVPFGRYYGSVDVTPLYITLLEATWRRTGRKDLLLMHLKTAESAMNWVQSMLQRNPSGLLSFDVDTDGLTVQSWKDSSDSMVYGDGRQATPPLAVAEVQGYVYQAFQSMAVIYDELNQSEKANSLREQAYLLQQRFHQKFWMEDLRYYAMAIDAQGNYLNVLSSDGGHCLWTGIIPQSHSQYVAQTLMSESLFSGWGIRTLGSNERSFNPYSYHRGSVWPHDTSLVGAGLAYYGHTKEVLTLANALIDAADRFPNHRLPELFSGVARGENMESPLPYPMACSPQAWASGAVWMLLTSVLKLSIDVPSKKLHVSTTPNELGQVHIKGLSLGESSIDLCITPQNVIVEGLPDGWECIS